MPTPFGFAGITPMTYKVVILCDNYPHATMQTNSIATANREFFKALPPGHDWHLSMFKGDELIAFRSDRK